MTAGKRREERQMRWEETCQEVVGVSGEELPCVPPRYQKERQ